MYFMIIFEKVCLIEMTAVKNNDYFFCVRLMEFVPPNKRSDEFFRSAFEEKGLAEVVKLHMAQVKNSSKFFLVILSPKLLKLKAQVIGNVKRKCMN